MPAVVAEGLAKSFGNTKALCGVDFDVERGQILGVLGPNGAGKSTTLGCITTLVRPTSGRILVDGIDVSRNPAEAKRRIALYQQLAGIRIPVTEKDSTPGAAVAAAVPAGGGRGEH